MATLDSPPAPLSQHAAPFIPIAESSSRVSASFKQQVGIASSALETEVVRLSLQADRALIAALIARTRGAAQRFILRHDAFLRTVVRSSSLGAEPVLDDLTHEVYVHLWRDEFRVLRQWQQQHPLRAYLRSVIKRLVWERLSRLQPAWEQLERDPMLLAAGLHEPTEGRPTTPEEEAARTEVVRSVRNALQALNASHRQMIELRYGHDLSYREIADVVGITPTNAGVRLTRALAHLKRALQHLIEELDRSSLNDMPSTPRLTPGCNKRDRSALMHAE